LPKSDIKPLAESLEAKVKRNLYFIAEEDFQGLVSESINGINAGYINQEIIKLSFWEKERCKNYCCLDSDAEFIRDFYITDFMHDEDTPYSVLIEDNDLKSDPVYYKAFWIEREKSLLKIQDELEYKTRRLLTCHGFQNFSSVVLRDFRQNFMDKKGYCYADLIRISPYEFTWYNIWLQKSRVIEIYPCDPLFKYFHLKQHLVFSKLQGIKLEDLGRSYVGVVIQSNYAKGGFMSYDDKDVGEIWMAIKLVVKSLKNSMLPF
jgi:hypothetical protein